MNVYVAWTLTLLYCITYPIYHILFYLAVAVQFLAKQLYRPLAFSLLPVVHLGRFIVVCAAAPFNLLARFETLYIYLGVGALVGTVGGLLLHYIYTALRPRDDPAPKAWTAKQYRAAKRSQKLEVEAPLISAGHVGMFDSASPRRSKGLLAQTIVEEPDSDY